MFTSRTQGCRPKDIKRRQEELQQAGMRRIRNEETVLKLQVLEEGPILRGRHHAGHEGKMLIWTLDVCRKVPYVGRRFNIFTQEKGKEK